MEDQFPPSEFEGDVVELQLDRIGGVYSMPNAGVRLTNSTRIYNPGDSYWLHKFDLCHFVYIYIYYLCRIGTLI